MARAEHCKFVHTKRQALDKLELGVRDTYERLETDRKQLASARALVVLAEKGYALSAKAYEVGAMTLNELQRKELDLNSAGMALNAALFGFHGAVIDLKLLMGVLSIHD